MKNERGISMENIIKYAELFDLLCENFDGAELGKKASQKMFYFFERKGINLNLRYGIHYYGPYSAKLDNILHILESEEYISIDTTGTTHVISKGTTDISSNGLTQEEHNNAQFVIKNFSHKSPLELEALATMDFVANYMNCNSKKEIVSTFKEIKGEKFDSKIIEKTYDILTNLDLISA